MNTSNTDINWPLGVASLWRWWTVQTVRFAAWLFAPQSPRTVTPAHRASAPTTEPATHTCTPEVHHTNRTGFPSTFKFIYRSLFPLLLYSLPGSDSPTCSNGVTPPNKSKSHSSSGSIKYPSASSSASSSSSSSPSSINYSESNSSDSTKSQPHSANSTQETRWEALTACFTADTCRPGVCTVVQVEHA